MQTPNKIEIFDRNFDYKDGCAIGRKKYSFDYLTLEKTKIQTPIISAAKGDFVHITDFAGTIVFQGIVDDYSVDKSICDISIKPLLSLFDIRVFYDRTDLASVTLENFLKGIIEAEYVTNTDTYQNIGMTVTTTSSTSNAILNLESNVGELYSIITAALSAYGIVVSAVLDPQNKEITVTIGTGASGVTIEADKPNVIDKNIVIGDSFGAVNKLTLINQDDETQTVTYYLHTDGTISTTDETRVWPVFANVEYISARDDFAAEALKKATDALAPQAYDNLIELTFTTADKLLDVDTIAIGTTVSVIDGENSYTSILTGYDTAKDTKTLVFGIVRIDLIKKLILEKRSSSNATKATSATSGSLISLNEVGAMVMWPGETAPTSWYFCDGSEKSRTTDAALFAVIGTTYGAGDGSTTFNLPNLKGRVAVGKDASQTEFDVLGETGGAKAVTLTAGQIPPLTYMSPGFGYPDSDAWQAPNLGFLYAYRSKAAIQNAQIVNSDGGGAHNNLQPYIVLNYIIRYESYTQAAKGDKGDTGQSAYAAAAAAGYSGTEAEFNADLAALDGLAAWFAAL